MGADLPASVTDEWPDVWAEYSLFYGRFYGITSEVVAASVTLLVAQRMARPDLDRVAEALKEFAIRAQERGVPSSAVSRQLTSPRDLTEAGALFGTPAEDLGLDALDLLVTLVRPRAGRP